MGIEGLHGVALGVHFFNWRLPEGINMDINLEEQNRLERLFIYCKEHPEKLNPFEKDFTEDNHKRFIDDKGGENGYFVSPKMWKVFARLESKLKLEPYI